MQRQGKKVFSLGSIQSKAPLTENTPGTIFQKTMDFVNPDDHLEEIATDTAVNGTAITVFELFKLGDSVIQQKESIADIYQKYTTNKLFCAG